MLFLTPAASRRTYDHVTAEGVEVGKILAFVVAVARALRLRRDDDVAAEQAYLGTHVSTVGKAAKMQVACGAGEIHLAAGDAAYGELLCLVH